MYAALFYSLKMTAIVENLKQIKFHSWTGPETKQKGKRSPRMQIAIVDGKTTTTKEERSLQDSVWLYLLVIFWIVF